MKKKILFIVFILFTRFPLYINSASPLLMMESINAKGYALSLAEAAEKGELSSLAVNPGGLAYLKGVSFGFFMLPLVEDMNIISLSCGVPLLFSNRFYGVAAIDYSSLSCEPIPNYDEFGQELPDLKVGDTLLNIAYAYPFSHAISAGLGLKYNNTFLGIYDSSGYAFDIGLLASLNTPSLTPASDDNNLMLGMAIQNLGSSRDYAGNLSSIPVKLRLAGYYIFYNRKKFDSSFRLEFNKTANHNSKINSGIEFGFIKIIKLRIGYQLAGHSVYSLTGGAGIEFNMQSLGLHLDYALVPLARNTINQAFSLQVRIGDIGRNRESSHEEPVPAPEEKEPEKEIKAAITNDIEKPLITVTEFTETTSIIVTNQTFLLFGQIRDNNALKSVLINNEEKTLLEKNFYEINEVISLSEGDNPITIIAEDLNNNKAEANYIVIFKKPVPAMPAVETNLQMQEMLPEEQSQTNLENEIMKEIEGIDNLDAETNNVEEEIMPGRENLEE